MIQKAEKKSFPAVTSWKILLFGVGIAGVVFLLSTGIFAGLISKGIVSQNKIDWIVATCCVISTFCGGKFVGSKMGDHSFLVNILSGLLFCLTLFLIGEVCFPTVVIQRESLLCLAGAVLGEVIAFLFKGRRKKKHRK